MNVDFSLNQKALRDQARKFLGEPASSNNLYAAGFLFGVSRLFDVSRGRDLVDQT
jgi:hypothetical protein